MTSKMSSSEEQDLQKAERLDQGKRSNSPEPSCVSMKSDQSVDRLINFREGNRSTEFSSEIGSERGYGRGEHTELIARCDIGGGVQGSEENKPTEGRWPRQHPRACTQGLPFRAGWRVCGHIQPVKTTIIALLPKKSVMTCLNDYRPVALTPIVMKCSERIVMSHIQETIPDTLDPLQFEYRQNRSTDDAVNTAIHTALTHLEGKDTYVRMLFIDYRSARSFPPNWQESSSPLD
ncbi:hypothetical protein NFI96_009655 [Prochilodus magdalenae]|nr:hypothetical protein NFI96_009655 [Prochilodus magdalenae]